MSGEPLYNSKIFITYLKLIRQRYNHINTHYFLNKTNIGPSKVAVPNCWFTQQQCDLFYENLSKETGDLHIARKPGRFSASPEANNFIRQHTLGFASPAKAFKNLQQTLARLAHSCTFKCRQIGPNKMEICVFPAPGIKENPGQCHFRKGLLEAIVTIFDLDMPHIDHPEYIKREDALLHDYGKIGVPDAILKKAGRLQCILQQVNFEDIDKRIPMFAGAHHEKIDGSGYPKDLTEIEIPLGAKIIAAADFLGAITALRHYREPMPLNIAYKALKQKAAAHFDSKIVRAFFNYFKKAYPEDFERMLRHSPAIKHEIERAPCRPPVVFKNQGQAIFGTSTKISTKGIFVANNTAITKSTPVKLPFFLPNSPSKIIEAGGRGVWINHTSQPRKLVFPSGFGVEFIDLHRQASDAAHNFTRGFPGRIHA